MHRKSKRFLSVLLSLFMCFSHLVTDVRAEGEEPDPVPMEVTEPEEEPEVTQEEEPGEVPEGEPEGNREDESPGETTGVLCWDGTYAETLEGCPVEPHDSEEPAPEMTDTTEPDDPVVYVTETENPTDIESEG